MVLFIINVLASRRRGTQFNCKKSFEFRRRAVETWTSNIATLYVAVKFLLFHRKFRAPQLGVVECVQDT